MVKQLTIKFITFQTLHYNVQHQQSVISSQRDCVATSNLDTSELVTFRICLCKKVIFIKCAVKDDFRKSGHIYFLCVITV